jgi:NAD(P)-dependent dehydrogenase (short-subunit alcohol dehydrogenase family)
VGAFLALLRLEGRREALHAVDRARARPARDPCRLRRGAIATPINADVLADPERKAAVQAEIPYGRWGEVADVARAVAWVASDEAEYVVGSTIFVDGGMTLYPRFE